MIEHASCVECTSAEAVEELLSLVNAGSPILDVTYGNGDFWKGSSREVIGLDLHPGRQKDGVGDFREINYKDGSFPTVVYDPPFHPSVGSEERHRYQILGNDHWQLRYLFEEGLKECWRVTSRHLLVKCQGYIHSGRPLWMPLWTVDILGEPFEWLIVRRDHKRISSKWKTVRSLRRNHCDYLLFDKMGNGR